MDPPAVTEPWSDPDGDLLHHISSPLPLPVLLESLKSNTKSLKWHKWQRHESWRQFAPGAASLISSQLLRILTARHSFQIFSNKCFCLFRGCLSPVSCQSGGFMFTEEADWLLMAGERSLCCGLSVRIRAPCALGSDEQSSTQHSLQYFTHRKHTHTYRASGSYEH